MCSTLEPATLASTILVAHQIEHEGRQVNVVGYQNTAASEKDGPNAMVLPIPSAAAMTQANCIDMTGVGGLFREYEDLVRPRSRGMSKGIAVAAAAADDDGIEVFDSGSYTVLLTKQFDLKRLRDVLAGLPEDKRIDINLAKAKVFRAFRKLYPDWYLAICIWNGVVKAEPILWWYEPTSEFVDNHFLPGLDAHDGNPPDPSLKSVPVDHTLITGIKPTRRDFLNADALVNKLPEHLRKWLPRHVDGNLLHHENLPNGDWVFPKGASIPFRLEGRRVSPPGYVGA